ncbi:MAG: hypothetical protein LBV58_04695 [Acholeplasmatales bacterium]|jgi:hypothetical protein|nr:hypothetical protein [Acholeplasmatales bacterium]
MADVKWNDVLTYVKSKYNVVSETPVAFQVEVVIPGSNRKQRISARYWISTKDKKFEYIDFYSAFANSLSDIESVLTSLSGKVFGGLVKINKEYCVRNTLPITDLVGIQIDMIFEFIGLIADELEKSISQTDEK